MNFGEKMSAQGPNSFPMPQMVPSYPYGQDPMAMEPQEMQVALMVAEKPSIAKTIANALSGGRFMTRRGESKFCHVFEFQGAMFGQPTRFRVTSVTGHIFSRDFPKKYADWYKTDPLSLFDAETIKRESNPASRLVQHLQAESIDAKYLVLWLDNDKEGENICFEVLDIVQKTAPKSLDQQIFRAKFSSITSKDIIHAFETLNSEPNLLESLSVDVRQIIDLKIGVTFSRFQSLYLKKKFQNLNQKMITYGPCQIPTLGFVVERDQKIKAFKPENFFKLNPVLELEGGDSFAVFREGERLVELAQVETLKMQLETVGQVLVTEVTKKETIRAKPEGLNTVALLKHASNHLGLGPNDAMHVAERLYLGGYMTYPRTETTAYAPSFDFDIVLNGLARSALPFGGYAAMLLQRQIERPRAGTDAGDHPPITPTPKTPNMGQLSNAESKMYDFVTRHFLATVSTSARIAKTKASFSCGTQAFSAHGSVMLDPGFTEINPWIRINDKMIPYFEKGASLKIAQVDIVKGATRAPEHLSESELITLMEKNQIGTDASMATHIHNIIQRNYAEVVTRARRIKPTPLGSALIQGYQDIDVELVSPELRSNIEKNVDLVAKGKKDYQSVLDTILQIFKQKFLFFRDNIGKMEKHFAQIYGTFQDGLKKGSLFSICGKCRKKMVLVADFHKIHCQECRLTLNLPKDASYSVEGQDFCPLDGFQLINYYILRKGGETHLKVCPQCYHRSPYPELSSRMICSQCPNDKCAASVANTEVKTCSRCKYLLQEDMVQFQGLKGKMILNKGIEGSFSITCNNNKCRNALVIVRNALDVRRLSQRCPSCKSAVLEIKRLNSPATSCCVFCQPEFSSQIAPPDINAKLGIKKREYRMQNQNSHQRGPGEQMGDRKRQFNSKFKDRKRYNSGRPDFESGPRRGGGGPPGRRGVFHDIGNSGSRGGRGRGGHSRNMHQQHNSQFKSQKDAQSIVEAYNFRQEHQPKLEEASPGMQAYGLNPSVQQNMMMSAAKMEDHSQYSHPGSQQQHLQHQHQQQQHQQQQQQQQQQQLSNQMRYFQS